MNRLVVAALAVVALAAAVVAIVVVEAPGGPDAPEAVRFVLWGTHHVIGVADGSPQELPKWEAALEMSGPALRRGEPFRLQAEVRIVDPTLLALLDPRDDVYLVAVLEPLYDDGGRCRQFTNLQGSCSLTPTGLPIESLQENLPARFKGNHYQTPWELVDARPLGAVRTEAGTLRFDVRSVVPPEVDDGRYRLAIELGARVAGHLLKLELVPTLAPRLIGADTDEGKFFSANETESTKIRQLHSPPFAVGDPAPARMPWTLFGTVDGHGVRGIVAREDRAAFAINYTGLKTGDVIVRRKAPDGTPLRYRLEPDFPTQARSQETFEKTRYYTSLTVLSHVQLDPPPLAYPSGELEVVVTTPSGVRRTLGKAPFTAPTEMGATTGSPAFEVTFDEYGRHEITMRGFVEDTYGNRYDGGGTYDVWVAEPLSMSTSCKPGTPFLVGTAYNPRVSVHPGVPADLRYQVTLYRNSSTTDAREWTHEGRANRYGYYFPREAFEPMVFDAPGEYRATVTASYTDPAGVLWMGTQTSASVVAPADSPLTVHGDRISLRTQAASPSATFGFPPRYQLFTGGGAGTPEIAELTTTQVRNTVPYHASDVLFFSTGLPWNVTEVHPFLTFETRDKEVEASVLAMLPPFEDYVEARFGESLADLDRCYGNYYARGSCRFWLLDAVDSFLHKAKDSLPVMSRTRRGWQPYAYQDDGGVLSYFYFSAIRPGMVSRQLVTDSTNTTAYWIVTPNTFARQFGAGESGDAIGDIYHIMGGVVYRDRDTGRNQYGIYRSTGVVADPRDENDRVEEPLRSPLRTVGGHDYLLLPGMSPEAGTLFEVGDRIAVGGFTAPSVKMDYRFRLEPPRGAPVEVEGATDDFGVFRLPGSGMVLDQAGVYTVTFTLHRDGLTGATVGKPDGRYFLYVVEKDSPHTIRVELPQVATFDPLDALELKARLPGDWASGRVHHTVVTPGCVLSDGELPVEDGGFRYRHVPLHSAVFTSPDRLRDVTTGRAGHWDTVVLNFFADGVSSSGARVTAATQVVVRGDTVYATDGEPLHGPPPAVAATPLYARYDLDTSPHLYRASDADPPPEPRALITRKCATCHQPEELDRSDLSPGDWRRLVSWHRARTPLWVQDRNQRALASALAATYPGTPGPALADEQRLVAEGDALLKAKCFACHVDEPILDRPHTRKGWDNLLDRQDYWARKTTGRSLYATPDERARLLDYLDLVAGLDGALPATADPARKTLRTECLRCHATLLKTLDGARVDRKAVQMHLRHRFPGREEEALNVLDLFPAR